jgi:hypothetical protein
MANRRQRCLALCSCSTLLLCAASSPAGNPSQHGAKSTSESQSQTNTQQNASGNKTAPPKTVSTSAHHSATSKHSAQHDEESGPKWTDIVIAISAIATVILTAILTISTVMLWKSTRRLWKGAEAQALDFKRSVEASERATEIAQSNLKISQDISKRELRAYLGIKSAMYSTSEENNLGEISFGFMIEIKNFGSTPAYCYNNQCDIRVNEFPIRNLPEVELTKDRTHTIAPGMENSIANGIRIPKEAWDGIKSGTLCMLITLKTVFLDYLEEPHYETIRFYIAKEGINRIEPKTTRALTFYTGNEYLKQFLT